jgi:hypothetical protein
VPKSTGCPQRASAVTCHIEQSQPKRLNSRLVWMADCRYSGQASAWSTVWRSPQTPLKKGGFENIPPLFKGGLGGDLISVPHSVEICHKLRLTPSRHAPRGASPHPQPHPRWRGKGVRGSVPVCGEYRGYTGINPVPGAQNSDDGAQNSNDGAQSSNDGVPSSNDGAQNSNDGAQNSNDGVPNSNDGAQNSNDGVPNSNDGTCRDASPPPGTRGGGWGVGFIRTRI